ncbi:MAG: hypothetical protein GY696_11995, partial [Gammaproteobacteria bacterium]|nr:hypothetical protein [Gammaproteobacteria bacterium]
MEKAAEDSLKCYNSSVVKGLKGWFLTKIQWKDRIHLDKVFVVPDTMSNILGKNFLRALGVQIDCGSDQVYKVLEPVTLSSVQSEFPRLFLDTLGTFPDYQHKIQLQADARPTTTRLRSVPLARREAVEKEVQNMVKSGVWEKVTRSEWVHGMVTVSKPGGGVRITTDLSPLNPYTVAEQHPIPNIKDILLDMRGAKVFTKLDLRKSFFHIMLHPDILVYG